MSQASGSKADTSAGHSSQFMPDKESGVLPSGFEIAQSMDWDCDLDPFNECHILLPGQMLVHPEGGVGSVTATGKGKTELGANSNTGKRKRDSNWTKDETSKLITLKKAFADTGSRTGKGRSEWDAIAAEMPTLRTGDQCRLRWDTLIKSYQKIRKHCRSHKKVVTELTPTERAELKLATTITEDWWYDVIAQFLPPRHRHSTSASLDVANDPLPSSLPSGTPPMQIGTDSFKQRESYPEQIAIPGFHSASHDLQCTLLNLILGWPTINFNGEMEAVCRWLAVMQDRKSTETRSFVLELRERNLLTFYRNEKAMWLKLGHLQVYSEFAKHAVRTHCYRVGVNDMVTFESTSSWRQTRVLTLLNCMQLESVDLGNFPMLRSLVIKNCPLLETLSGWENLPELRWLEIDECRSYRTYPDLHHLASLREAHFERRFSLESEAQLLRFDQSIRLSRLEVSGDEHLKQTGDLSNLKCLKLLSFRGCGALCAVSGLSGLHSLVSLNLEDCKSLRTLPGLENLKALQELKLSGSGVEEIDDIREMYCVTHLDLGFCKALRALPPLGHLTDLEHLNISGSGGDDIGVVKKLRSLRKLDLSGCEALKRLPHVGHLTALAELNVDFTAVEEIPGVETLQSLESMDCYRSQLKVLPDLRHLRRLQWVDLRGTPVTAVRSFSYFERTIVRFNEELGGGVGGEGAQAGGVVGDSEHSVAHFDEELYDKFRAFYPPKCDTLN